MFPVNDGTDEPEPRSDSLEAPALSLPTGGGAIKGIDEKLSVNASNGTATLSVPLPFSPARDAEPTLRLDYNSGAGNSAFGLGWSLSLPSIKRKTEGKLPRYLDADAFVHDGETLVPVTGGERDSPCGQFAITSYRPRIEGGFSRLERWTHKATGELRWREITRHNQTTLFGWSAASRIADPDDERRVFEWLPELVFDDRGNCAHYLYVAEDDAGFDPALLHNRNRRVDGALTYTNRYLERVLYGNRTPYRGFGAPPPAEADYFFHTRFVYGGRGDPFSDYKAGFEIRTTRLCLRVEVIHHFPELPGGSAVVKALDLGHGDPGEFSFLRSITEHGYIKRPDGSYAVAQLPPIELDYRTQAWNTEVKTVADTGLSPRHQFVDLYNEGLSGLLTEQGEGWYYQRNLGKGRFATARPVSRKPSFAGIGARFQVLDLGGDGRKQLVSLKQEPRGYFELDEQEEWQTFRNFESLPNVNFGNANVRLIDLDGDGRLEALVSEDNVFTWYDSTGRKGFTGVHKAPRSFDEEQAPQLVFADAAQTIFLADMSGDGLTDIVRIRNGQVCYWPNLGYGRFGAKVNMDSAPVFDHPDAFNPELLRLADIDGSGTADIIYLGKSRLSCWKNLSGNRFSAAAFEMEAFPEIHNHAQVSVVNLLGDGVACIVWASSLAKDVAASFKYIDLMSGKKPHLLIGYRNNLGKEVSIDYTSSARFYLDDQLAGRPWVTRLHFPVHCVSRTEICDRASGHRSVSSYRYHHGHFDHAEREFRGFGMVEQTDSEDFDHVERPLHQTPVVTRRWFHTGAWLGTGKTLDQFAHEYWPEEVPLTDVRVIAAPGLDPALVDRLSAEDWREALRACKGRSLRTEVFAGDAPAGTPCSVEARSHVVVLVQPRGGNAHAVFAVEDSETLVYEYDGDAADPRIAHRMNLELDEHGNVLAAADITYPRRRVDASLPAATQAVQARTVVVHTRNRYTDDAIDGDSNRLRLLSETIKLELGEVARAGACYRLEELRGELDGRLIEHVRHTFYDDGLAAALPLHRLTSRALPCETLRLAYTPALLAGLFGGRVDDAVMLEGRYTRSEGDDGWWVSSGSKQHLGLDGFFQPVGFTDGHGARSKVRYYRDYFLFMEAVEDAAGNLTRVERFNFRTLAPVRLIDANANVSEVLLDELGRVKAMAFHGKGDEADDLTGLTEVTGEEEAQCVREFFAAPDPTRLAARLLQHASARFVYDRDAYQRAGRPAAIASIVRAEHHRKDPDARIQVSVEYSGGLGRVVLKKEQAARRRWIGSGRTVLNNKGNPVKQYEPYFADSHRFEATDELAETGVTPLRFYDPLGRLVRTELPDGTSTRTDFGAWKQVEHDANDTAADSPHAGTPEVRAFDGRGRTVLIVAHNRDAAGADQWHHTSLERDVDGRLRSVTDARGNLTARYRHDLLGQRVHQDSLDAGRRWLLPNAAGHPLRAWDERDHEVQYGYDDPLHRPTHRRVIGGDGPVPLDHVFDRRFYGEVEPDAARRNLRGQLVRHYDTAGLLEVGAYDLRGKPSATTRWMAKDYRGIVNWVDGNLRTALEDRGFRFATETDALGKPVRRTVPDGRVITTSYDEGGRLHGERVTGEAEAEVAAIDYNARGQRERVVYGNGVVTRYSYDPQTFRLRRMETRRGNGDLLQDWHYAFDPAGNLTRIEDRAAPVVFFDNHAIASVATYTYDALDRLIEASGRENVGGCDPDAPPHLVRPGDPLAMRRYTQRYDYDAVGNLVRLRHRASGHDWTRTFDHAPTSNRLGGCEHHARHGFVTAMPHLEALGWNFLEQLAHSARQRRVDGGTAETTYYQYDAEGRRLRKITEHQAAAGATPARKDERLTLDGYELYTRHSGEAAGLERVSLSLMDQGHRFATVETRNAVDDGTEARLVRYQLHDHLGSTALELEGSSAAAVISYETYHPYGTTAYRARNASIRCTARRYRFTGMERDEESGLAYHGARYYAPWLGRWLSCDPRLRDALGAASDGDDGPDDVPEEPFDREALNPYAYASQSPVVYRDPTGEVPILQEWYDAYDKAGTAGKVGLAFVFIFAWLMHVIANLFVLAISLTVLNVFGAFGLWDFTYGGIQSVIGLAIGIFTVLLGADVTPQPGMGARVALPEWMGSAGAASFGMSFGPVIIGSHSFTHWNHEFGHTWQSRVLGPLYFFIIGIPSAVNAWTNPAGQSTFYTERWADAWDWTP